MPATSGDISAAIREQAQVRWSSSTIATRYPSARDGSTNPAKGYFDSASDAQAVVDARGALLGTERRRFVVTVQELLWYDLDALPTVRLTDPEHNVDADFLITRYEVDLEAEVTRFELFG